MFQIHQLCITGENSVHRVVGNRTLSGPLPPSSPARDLHSIRTPTDQIQESIPSDPTSRRSCSEDNHEHLKKTQIHQRSFRATLPRVDKHVVSQWSFHLRSVSMWFQYNQWRSEKFISMQLAWLLFGIDYTWSKTDCFLIEWANISKEHLNELYHHSMRMAEHCTKVYFHLVVCVFIIQK